MIGFNKQINVLGFLLVASGCSTNIFVEPGATGSTSVGAGGANSPLDCSTLASTGSSGEGGSSAGDSCQPESLFIEVNGDGAAQKITGGCVSIIDHPPDPSPTGSLVEPMTARQRLAIEGCNHTDAGRISFAFGATYGSDIDYIKSTGQEYHQEGSTKITVTYMGAVNHVIAGCYFGSYTADFSLFGRFRVCRTADRYEP